MNCKKCGSPLAVNDQFCKNCGETVNSQPTNMGGYTHAGMPNTNNLNQQSMNTTQPYYSNNMNSNRQGWPNYNNFPTYNNQPMNKPSGNGKYIAIGFAILIGIIAIVVVVIMVLGGKDNPGTNNGGGSPVVNNKSTYTVNFKGFAFKIPTDLVYETEADSILLGDEEGTWATHIEVIEGSYNQLLSNKNQLQGIYQQQGYTSSAAVIKKVGGLDFITLEISKGGQNALLGLAKANSMNIFGITAYTQANDFDYDLLETVSSILSSAEYTGETNNISENIKIDMSAISELAK